MKKIVGILLGVCLLATVLAGCDIDSTTTGTQADTQKTIQAANTLQKNSLHQQTLNTVSHAIFLFVGLY